MAIGDTTVQFRVDNDDGEHVNEKEQCGLDWFTLYIQRDCTRHRNPKWRKDRKDGNEARYQRGNVRKLDIQNGKGQPCRGLCGTRNFQDGQHVSFAKNGSLQTYQRHLDYRTENALDATLDACAHRLHGVDKHEYS